MKINKTRLAAAASVVVVAAIAWKRNTLHETLAEVSWRASAALSFFLTWVGQSASTGMGYLDNHSSGVAALCSILGLGFSIYFQIRNSKKDKE